MNCQPIHAPVRRVPKNRQYIGAESGYGKLEIAIIVSFIAAKSKWRKCSDWLTGVSLMIELFYTVRAVGYIGVGPRQGFDI